MASTKQTPVAYQTFPKPGQLTLALLRKWSMVGRELASWLRVR